MIKSFLFENFKSFYKSELDIENLSIIIGSNASGKSNAIEGIKILSEITTGRELSVILDGSKNIESGIRGGSKGCPRFNSDYFTLGCIISLDETVDFEYKVSISVGDRVLIKDESLIKIFRDNSSDLVFKTKKNAIDSADIKVEYNNGKKGRNPDVQCIRSSCVLSQLPTKLPASAKPTKADKEVIHIVNKVIEHLKKMLLLDPLPNLMRDYSRITDAELRPKADNLSSVIFKLFKDKENKKRILSFMANLPENEIIDIDFVETSIGDIMIRLREKYNTESNYIEAKRLSDGTLRCLSVIASLMIENEGSIVIIEEVDNGIHPSRAKGLIDTIADIAMERKIDVIITTHNPALLNALKKDDLLGVVVCYRDNDGNSDFISLTDIKRFPELMAKGKLGDLAINDDILHAIKAPRKRKNSYKWMEV